MLGNVVRKGLQGFCGIRERLTESCTALKRVNGAYKEKRFKSEGNYTFSLLLLTVSTVIMEHLEEVK